MGFFDKEKLAEMANKAKDTMKDGVQEVKDNQAKKKEDLEKRKVLGLLGKVVVNKIEYKGGHPAITKEKSCSLSIDDCSIIINIGKGAPIGFGDIDSIHFETAEQINRRITATRLVLLGPFALAFKKKKMDKQKYLTIDFNFNGVESTCVFGGKNVMEAHAKLLARYSNFLKRVPKKETEDNIQVEKNMEQNDTVTDPYEELKKLKELMDMGIISQEEFDTKKKELLDL